MAEKQKLMLISPMLHQGGFERVCVTTARLLQEYYEITIVIFDSADIAFDIEGLNVIDIGLGVREGKVQKLINVFRRACKIKALKKEMKTDTCSACHPFFTGLKQAVSSKGRAAKFMEKYGTKM